MWTVGDLENYLGKHRTTIQRWGELVAGLLDERANPGSRKTRNYTPRDVAIIEEVGRLFDTGRKQDQVLIALTSAVNSGQFDDVADYPVRGRDEKTIPVEEVDRIVSETRGGLTVMRGRVQDLESQNQDLFAENAALNVRVEMLGEQIEDLKERLDSGDPAALSAANKEIEMLRQQLEEVKNKKRGLFGRRD